MSDYPNTWIDDNIRLTTKKEVEMKSSFFFIKRASIKQTSFWAASLLAGVLIGLNPSAVAKPITVTAIGHNSEARYINAPYLPYANPMAPKGGTL